MLLLATLLAHEANADAPFTLDALLAEFADPHASRIEFIEKQYIHYLNRPLESSGELVFSPPDRFEKHTVRPKEERLVAQGDRLSWQQGAKRREAQLSDVPEARPLIESLRATLFGDRATLERFFDCKVRGAPASWQLELRPRNTRHDAGIEKVTLRGRAAAIDTVIVRHRDGDRSELILRN